MLRIKETGKANKVIAVSIFPSRAQETLMTALTISTIRAILVETDDAVEPLAAAKILKVVVEEEGPGVVVLGKQAIDDDANETGQMLAALLGRPQGAFASEVKIEGDHVVMTREVDAELETVKLSMPAIVTTKKL